MNLSQENKLLFSPSRPNRPDNIAHINSLLDGASKTIDVCIYCFTYKPMADLIIAKHRAGIKVRCITSSKKEDPNDLFWFLQEANIEVRRNSNFIMHNKFVIIDSKVVIHGSGNWTITGFHSNYETFRTEEDDSIVQNFCNRFERLWSSYVGNADRLPRGTPIPRSYSNLEISRR